MYLRVKRMNIDELKQIFINIKKDKKAMIIVVIGVVGMLLIMLSESGDSTETEDYISDSPLILSERELALDVEGFIEKIEGAGDAKVILTFESFEETVYAVDKDENFTPEGKTDYAGEYVIIDSGDSESGLKLKILSPKIRGVAVICKGGDDPIVKEQIIMAISALFDISTNKISVAAMAT